MCQVLPSQKTEEHVFIFLRVPNDKTRPGRAVGAPQSSPADRGGSPPHSPACRRRSSQLPRRKSNTRGRQMSLSILSSLSFLPRPLCSSSAQRLVALSHAAVLVWCAHTHAFFLTSVAYLLNAPQHSRLAFGVGITWNLPEAFPFLPSEDWVRPPLCAGSIWGIVPGVAFTQQGLEKRKWKSLSPETLCDPMDYTVHEILQARIL